MAIITSRRAFITGLTGIIAAPAIVRAASLMPVRAVETMRFQELHALHGVATPREFTWRQKAIEVTFSGMHPNDVRFLVNVRVEEALINAALSADLW